MILSDTHLPKKSKNLPEKVMEELKKVDGIMHLGDFKEKSVYLQLLNYASVEAVYGNVDDHELQILLPLKKVIQIEGVKIGLIHGHGKGKTTEKRVIDAFQNEDVNLILFGHSHVPLSKKLDGFTLFNPGSPTDKRRQKQFSYGVLEVNGSQFRITHQFFD